MLRGQLLRPGFVRLSLRLGLTRQMPAWAKLQFTNNGITAEDLDFVLGRITSLESWVDEWESLGRAHEQAGHDALKLGKPAQAGQRFLWATPAYNFAQYVVFMDPARKKQLHAMCVAAYALACPHTAPPGVPFEVEFRKRPVRGALRIPQGDGPHPVVVIFNGTNGVKEELHDWSDAYLARGIATISLDGPGLGQTFHRLSSVAEPRPLGVAIMNHIESMPELDSDAVGYMGLSLGGYAAIRMASHDRRVRAVAAVSPPYSVDVYWNVTLFSMRRELASLYQMSIDEMDKHIPRITLADTLPELRAPLMLASGGHDMITPSDEAQRPRARCERAGLLPARCARVLNVLDLRPRMTGQIARQLAEHRTAPRAALRRPRPARRRSSLRKVWTDFADDLAGEGPRVEWHSQRRTAAGPRA
jgi:2,6-dihydroxypseudooxynicotine hydrolase